MSIGERRHVNRHTVRCTSPVSMVWQCKRMSGWGLRKRRSAPLYGSYGSGRTLLCFLLSTNYLSCTVHMQSVTLRWTSAGASSSSGAESTTCPVDKYVIRLRQAGVRKSRAWKLEPDRLSVSLHDLRPHAEYQVRWVIDQSNVKPRS